MNRNFYQAAISSALTIFVAAWLSSCASKHASNDGSQAAMAAAASSNGVNGADEGSSEMRTVYFAFDDYKLNKDSREALKFDAEYLSSHPNVSIQIGGHCDERGSTEYNLALGEKRATAVKNYLEKLGVSGAKLSTISYGSEHPVDPGHDEDAWSKNRRAVPSVTSHNVTQN